MSANDHDRLTSPFRHLTGATGGLTYHLAALRYRNSAWVGFRRHVDLWLNRVWRPKLPGESVVIFGPSAGWSLSDAFIAGFKQVEFIEPDPVARWVLRSRFPRSTISGRSDLLPWFDEQFEFERFIASRPTSAFLFANVLGQIPLLLSSADREPSAMEKNSHRFLKALKEAHWASYHDRLSFKFVLPSDLEHRLSSLSNLAALDLATVIGQSLQSPGEVTDHETDWLPHEHLALWKIRRGTHHLVGFGYREPSAKRL